jgi:hypothetical protein
MPPGGFGTTTETGRVGYSCATTLDAASANAIATIVLLVMLSSSGFLGVHER